MMFKRIAISFLLAVVWMWICTPIVLGPDSETKQIVTWILYPILFCVNWTAFFLYMMMFRKDRDQ